MKHTRTGVCVVLVVCGAAALTMLRHAGTLAVDSSPAARSHERVRKIVATGTRWPVAFEMNEGQVDPSVRFITRGAGYQLFLTDDGATWALQRSMSVASPRRARASGDDPHRVPDPEADAAPAAIDVVRMRLLGANASVYATGANKQPGKAHYFGGNDRSQWRTNVPTFGRVHYNQIYPGIDLVYYGREGQLEYDFRVAPGVDPSLISLAFEGADRLFIDAGGDLVVEARAGRLVHRRPMVYQDIAGDRRVVDAAYVLTGQREVRFSIGEYDRTHTLVIDPVLVYATYVGGTGGAYGDHAYGVAIDAHDNVYVTGQAGSTAFPVGGQPANGAAYVLKLSPGGELVYVTIINGNAVDSGEGIAVDANGQVVITGFTDSTDFPTVNPIQLNAAGRDAFVAKLDVSGSIVYSTYLGGSNTYDYGEAVALDAAGNAYVAGTTKSPDFPVLNALQPVIAGADAFVVKIDPSGTLLYSTFLGGTKGEAAEAIAVDETGSFYVAGWTTSTNFPRVQYMQGKGGGEDAFVTQFTPDGSELVYSRYLGGSSNERAYAIALDGEGGVYVGGYTDSTNFPSLLPVQGDQPGTDAFVTRLGPNGLIAFSTYLGGGDWERVLGFAVRDQRLFITGQTFSTDMYTLDALQSANGGLPGTADAFVTVLDTSTSTPLYSTYLGGSGDEEGRGVVALSGGNVFVVGWTESADFPTVRAIQDFKSNTGNVFVARIAPLAVLTVAPDFVLTAGGTALTITGEGFLAGATVRVGGQLATSVSVLSGEMITATSPTLPSAGKLDVTVINPDGGSGTLYGAVLAVEGTGPVADAGPDQTVEATTAAGGTVILDGTASFDPDEEPLTFAWRDAANNTIAAGALASVVLPVGDHTITLIVSDGHSTPGTDTVLVRVVDTTPPSVTVVSPNGGNRLFTGTPASIEWTASDLSSGVAAFDVYVSTNGGKSYDPTPICAAVPGTQRSCTWASPGPAVGKARVRVVARDGAGNSGADTSDGNFTIVSGAGSINVTSPNTAVSWAAGSTQLISWGHNLGAGSFVRLDLSVDGGSTWSPVASAVQNSSSSKGSFTWTVPPVVTTSARVRVSWNNGPVSDQSNVDFAIVQPVLQLSGVGAGANWGYGTIRKLTWATNLGANDLVDVELSLDGGATFPITLVSGVPAGTKSATFTTPALPASTDTAQIRLRWTNAPSGVSASSASASFTLAPPFITVTWPNGGESWPAGKKKAINWSSNLGNLESVRIELSLDAGATYPVVVLSSTPSDGTQAVVSSSGWITNTGRIRITWLGSSTVHDLQQQLHHSMRHVGRAPQHRHTYGDTAVAHV